MIKHIIEVITWVVTALSFTASFTNARGKKIAFIIWLICDLLNIVVYIYYGIPAKLVGAIIQTSIAIMGIYKNKDCFIRNTTK